MKTFPNWWHLFCDMAADGGPLDNQDLPLYAAWGAGRRLAFLDSRFFSLGEVYSTDRAQP